MKYKLLISFSLFCTLFNSLSSQNFSPTDSLTLLAIDESCDVTGRLNWNTEPDPGNWAGVTWNAENPKRVTELRVYDRTLTGSMIATTLTKLTHLDCSNNQLNGLDVSILTNLTFLSCYNNQLTALDISELINLTSLTCSSNQIAVLDVSGLVNLTHLGCSVNQISMLDVSGLVKLTYLACNLNQLSVLNVTELTSLTELYCQANHIAVLDVSELTNLTLLSCYSNELASLNVASLTKLTELYCYNNQLNDLNVSSLINLTRLYCSINPIGELDVSDLTNLIFLSCYVNELTSLDVSTLENLATLVCSGNQLTELDVSVLTNMELLICNDNQLTHLDVPALTKLTGLYCYGNHLAVLDVSVLSDLEYLECFNNRLPFSSLATGLHVDNFIFIPQDMLFEPQSFIENITLDYTDEALINGTATEFIFYRNGMEAESNSSGIFTTTGSGEYYCTMTNAKFPGLTLTTAAFTVTEVTGIKDMDEAGFKIYPNPVAGKLTVHLSQQGFPSLTGIYTVDGKEVGLVENSSSVFEIDMETFQPGIYILKIITPESRFAEEIVKF